MDRASVAHLSMPSSVAEAYLRYRAELCRYVTRTFGSAVPDPQDIVQSAFTRFAALADPSSIENPRAFLYRTAHNAAVEHLRRETTRSKFEQGLQADAAEILDDCDGERVLLLRERHRILEAVIAALEPKRRKILVMNRIHGLSFAEISRRTGISQTQVKRLAADAIVECNAALRRAWPDERDLNL